MSSSDEEFFRSPKAAAVFKHAVLDQYLVPYAMKTGVREPHRVAFVDGYAGPGIYDDGSPGSPARVMQAARDISDKRNLELHFIEKKTSFLDSLRSYTENNKGSLSAKVYDGDINEHLDALITSTKETPTLFFLDPFGLVIPFESVRRLLDRPAGFGLPNMEVLINFSAVALRRIAGTLTSENPVQATLDRMDAVCGGSWWRDTWRVNSGDSTRAEEAVTAEYARRLAGGDSPSYGWWAVDVKNRPNHKPAYYLVFLSRHRDGLELFGESASLALTDWRRKIFEDDNVDYALFGSSEQDWTDAESALAESWVACIEANCGQLLREIGSFTPGEHYSQVFGTVLGEARQTHLRSAWRNLYESGETSTNPRGERKLLRTRMQRA